MFSRARLPRVQRSTLVLLLAVAALAFPLGVLANHQFSDVPTAASYHDDVEALVNAGITSGCTASTYCPAQAVTRAQMAQFLNRLGSLDGNTDPSVNAATSQATDGWSLGCPSGTVWSQGLCFETSNRAAATVYVASDTCAAAGSILGGWRYHLPTIHQLRSARGASGITLDVDGEHTDSLFRHDAAFWSFVTYESGGIDELVGNTTRKFRCVTPPQSFDPFIIIIPLDEQQSRYPAPPQYGDTLVGEDGAPIGD